MNITPEEIDQFVIDKTSENKVLKAVYGVLMHKHRANMIDSTKVDHNCIQLSIKTLQKVLRLEDLDDSVDMVFKCLEDFNLDDLYTVVSWSKVDNGGIGSFILRWFPKIGLCLICQFLDLDYSILSKEPTKEDLTQISQAAFLFGLRLLISQGATIS